MATLRQIQTILNRYKTELEEEYGVTRIGVFGSVAKGSQNPESDIDVLVEFGDVPDLLTFCRLELRLENLLGTEIDLVRQSALRSELKDQILSEVVYI
jgi:uncharacterized protein